jgi:predicted alpha-1,6-mannanase (GH76 family)
MQQRFLDLVKAEVDVVQDAYQKQRRKHLQDVLAERKKRNLKTEDLENDEFYTDMNVE